mmetsp:Transcript_50067/g.60419  ORF Transcript_50067/g.60419 Transcript_50067/m.60419 type:complete len:115 (+) Transcript_50067:182-526(+)
MTTKIMPPLTTTLTAYPAAAAVLSTVVIFSNQNLRIVILFHHEIILLPPASSFGSLNPTTTNVTYVTLQLERHLLNYLADSFLDCLRQQELRTISNETTTTMTVRPSEGRTGGT